MSPFYITSGIHPMDFLPASTASANLPAEEFTTHMKDVHLAAAQNLQKAAEDMKRFHDRHASEPLQLSKGDKVFLDGRHLKTSRPSAKMEDKWFGPFEILHKVGASAYRLKIPRSWKKVHPVFNEILLKPAVDPAFPSQIAKPPPPPVLVNNEKEYEIEEICDSRIHRDKL